MTLSKRLSLAFAAEAAFFIAVTLLLVSGVMLMEAHRQVDAEQRRVSRLAGELFRAQCASMQAHIAALAGDKTTQIIAEYTPGKLGDLLMKAKPIAHVDSLFVVQRDSMNSPPVVLGEAIGNDFIKPIENYSRLFTTATPRERVEVFELESGRIGSGFAVQIPAINGQLFWLFGVIELESRVVQNIGQMLEVSARLLPDYPKELSIFRFELDLMNSDTYAGIVDLRGCQDEHVAWLEFKFPLQPFRDALWQQAVQLALMGVLLVAAGIFMGMGMARKLATPIEAIQAAVQRMQAGELEARVDVQYQTEAELRKLGEAVNAMAATLEKSIKERETLLVLVGAQLKSSTRAFQHLSGSHER